ncbi:hypothetical protein [Ensifer adhaerens]
MTAMHEFSGVDRLEPTAINALDINDFDAFGPQQIGQAVMLGLQFLKRRDAVALPVPACLEVAIGADFLDALGAVDDGKLLAGAMHQDGAELPDVVVAPPVSTPEIFQPLGRLESGLGDRAEILDRRGVEILFLRRHGVHV